MAFQPYTKSISRVPSEPTTDIPISKLFLELNKIKESQKNHNVHTDPGLVKSFSETKLEVMRMTDTLRILEDIVLKQAEKTHP